MYRYVSTVKGAVKDFFLNSGLDIAKFRLNALILAVLMQLMGA